MVTTRAISFFLATHLLHAESIAPSISTSTTAALVGSIADTSAPSSPLDDDEKELAKIAASCMTGREHKQMAGGMLRHGMARLFNVRMVREALKAIGLAELRTVAGFAPPGPWTAYRVPTSDEIAAAPTVEAYYELREPRSEERSLDSDFFFESNFPPAIGFLDARFPAIRASKFEAIRRRRAQVSIDRDEVDQLIHEYLAIYFRVRNAMDDVLFAHSYDC